MSKAIYKCIFPHHKLVQINVLSSTQEDVVSQIIPLSPKQDSGF